MTTTDAPVTVERLQAAWNAVATLPPIDFTESEASAILAALASAPAYPSLELCVQFSDDGQHIRKWSRVPFDGGECLYSHPASAPAGDQYGKWHPMLLDLVNAIHRDWGEKTQAIGIDLSYQHALAAALARPRAAVETVDCNTCGGNGEIVTDWDRYMHAHDGDKGDEAVADCPDCGGTGKVEGQA